MPFDPDEVVVDFLLPPQTTGVTRLLVAALPQQEMATHLALKEAELEPAMVDLDVFALANAAVFGSAFLPSHAVLIDHAVERTLLTILQTARLYLHVVFLTVLRPPMCQPWPIA